MKKIEKTRYSLLVLCLLAAGGSALCFLREYGVTYLLRGSEPEIIAGIKAADAENDLPMSARGTRELITKCANLSLASPQLAAAPVDRAAFNESCSALAKSILDRNPSSSRTLAAKLVFMDALTTADYAAAQQSAPYEPWPLGTRLLVLERNAPLSTDLLPIAEADIAAAFVSSWGRELLAGIYIRKEPLRPLILKVAETRPPEEQRAFLQMTRKQVRTDG